MILVLDNRDSFTFNLVQALQRLGARVEVMRAESVTADDVLARSPHAILLGPGPGRPEDARTSLALLARELDLPLLGVCLGHQALAHHAGAVTQRAAEPMHGRTVSVEHAGVGVFRGLPSPLACARYNSLSVRRGSLPPSLEMTAWTSQGDVMGLRHRSLPWEGVQFHPESILSEGGDLLLTNFLRAARGSARSTASS